jgi:hypothetical protein
MTRVEISAAAYEVIEDILPTGAVKWPVDQTESGKIFVWISRQALNRLERSRRQGEDLSDTIVRIAEMERGGHSTQ